MDKLPVTPKQMAELMKVASSPAGKQILYLLQKDHGPALEEALSRKDYQKAKAIAGSFLEREDVKVLLKQLR